MKPIIQDPEQLTPLYRRYRDHLCEADSALDNRLRTGAMQRVTFTEISRVYDVILFDAYGVLNRGKEAIAGAVATIAGLKQAGCALLVVSNNASQSPSQLAERFQQMGFNLGEEEIISSGMAVKPFVAASPYANLPYYLVGTPASARSYAPNPEERMVNQMAEIRCDWPQPLPLHDAGYILMCSNRDYYGGIQEQQVESLLAERDIPILLANPDLVAPDATGVSVVAGYTAAQWTIRYNREIVGIGKPFPAIFSMARQRFPQVAAERFLMVGDTLDTDVLGGAAQGFHTCLTLSGAYAQMADTLPWLCQRRMIYPDYVVSSIAA